MENLNELLKERDEINKELATLQKKLNDGEGLTPEDHARLNYIEKRGSEIDAIFKKLKMSDSDILHKRHTFGSGVKLFASNGFTILGLGIVGVAGALLGLNAVSSWAQNFSLFGQSWGPIFGQGTSHALNGVLSAAVEASKWVGIPAVLGVSTNAIINREFISNFRKENKDIKALKLKGNFKDLDDSKITDNLFSSILYNNGIFTWLEDAKMKREKTKNPYERYQYYRRITSLENYINKAIVKLGERLNELSIDVKASEGVLDSDLFDKFKEMEKIQKFFLYILDRDNNSDAYFKTLKKVLKKHKSTITLGTIFSSDKSTEASDRQKSIDNNILVGKIDQAIKDFCTYGKPFVPHLLEGDPLCDRIKHIDDFIKRVTGLEEIGKNVGRSFELVEGLETTKIKADNIFKKLESLYIEGISSVEGINGSLNRARLYEKWCKELYDNLMLDSLQLKKFKGYLRQVDNNLKDDLSAENIAIVKQRLINTLKKENFDATLISTAPAIVDLIATVHKAPEVSQTLNEAVDNAKEKGKLIEGLVDKTIASEARAKESADNAKKAEDEAEKTLEHIKKIAKKCDTAVKVNLRNFKATLKKLKELENDVNTGYWLYSEAASENNQKLKQMIEIYSQSVISYEEAAKKYLLLIHEAKTREELENAVKLLQEETDSMKAEIKTINETITETQAKVAEIDERTAKIIESINSLRDRVISDEKLLDVIEKTSVSRSDFRKIQKVLATHQNDTQKLEEIVSWLEKNVDELTKENKVLSSQLVELVEQIYSVESAQAVIKEKLDPAKEPAAKYVESEEHKQLIKTSKNYLHAIHRALKDGNRLPEVLPTSMRGKKQTQSEIAEQGGRNLDFSVGSKFRSRVNSICEQYLKGKELKYAQEFAEHELAEFNEEQLHAYINLIQKACIAYNNDHQTGPKV